MENENKNQVLSSNDLWERACSGLSATRSELGLSESQSEKTGIVSLNFELNHDKNSCKSDE